MALSPARVFGLWLGYAALHGAGLLLAASAVLLALAAFGAAPDRWPLLLAAAPPAAALSALVPLRRQLRPAQPPR